MQLLIPYLYCKTMHCFPWCLFFLPFSIYSAFNFYISLLIDTFLFTVESFHNNLLKQTTTEDVRLPGLDIVVFRLSFDQLFLFGCNEQKHTCMLPTKHCVQKSSSTKVQAKELDVARLRKADPHWSEWNQGISSRCIVLQQLVIYLGQ